MNLRADIKDMDYSQFPGRNLSQLFVIKLSAF